jgi:hypothetical protein
MRDSALALIPRVRRQADRDTSQTPARLCPALITASSWFGYRNLEGTALSERVATRFRGEYVDSWAGSRPSYSSLVSARQG